MNTKKAGSMAATVMLIVFLALLSMNSAFAAGGTYGKAWEDLGGARWNGYMQIMPCELFNGRHPRIGYLRFMREGDNFDTGYVYTSAASSPSCDIRSVSKSVWDSPLWGDAYTTKFYWGVSSSF